MRSQMAKINQRRRPGKVPRWHALHSGKLRDNAWVHFYTLIDDWEPSSEPSNTKPSNFLELMKSTV